MKTPLFALAITTLLVVSSFQVTTAQVVSVETETQVDAQVTPDALPRNPLKALKEKAQGVKANIQLQNQEIREERRDAIENAQGVRTGIKAERKDFWTTTQSERVQMRAETKAQLEAAATPEERKALLLEARKDRAEFRAQVKTDAADMRAGFATQWKDVRASVRDVVGDRFQMILSRLVNALERFDQILTRIDSRIEKLQADGIDVSAAVSASAEANTSIDAASVAVADAKVAIDAAAASETPREHLDEVRVAVQAATAAVKAAHEDLKEALRALKSIAPTSNTEAEIEAETN